MSLTALNSTIYNLTLDGLINIDADSLTVDGKTIDATDLVPYTGAIKTVDLADQNIKSSYYPVVDEDLVNLFALQNNLKSYVKFIGSTRNTNLGTYGLSGGDLTANSSLTVNGITSLVGNITASSNLNVSGLTTLGQVQSNFTATSNLDLTNKNYVDNLVSNTSSLLVPYTGATTLLNLGSNSLTASTAKFTAITSATPSLALGVDALGNLNTFAVPSGASFPFNGTTNINGSLKTIQDPIQYNPSLDANSYFITGVFPTTYTFSSPTWIVNPVSGTIANIQLDPSIFYFSTTTKYVISFTGIFGTSASWTGTIFNNSTSTIVSDAPIAITTTSQNLTMTFTPGSSNPTIYLRFDGASGTLRITNLSIKQVDTEVMGNLAISSQIDSNITLANGKTANFANGLKVNQTSISTAPSLTTASLPVGVSASTLSGTYTLTATAGGTTFGMWLGSSFTYTAGAKYTYTFTGFSTNATASQAMILYTNTYTGGLGTSIGDYIVNVPITSSTVSGSFTATSNNNVVWNFVSSALARSISFATFTLERADTHISGIATLPTNTGTAVAGLGLNSSNQIVNTAVPANFSAVSVGSVPYESAADTFSNSLMTQGNINLGYSGASFTAGAGIGSITFASPTYSANSSSSFQGVINASAIPSTYLNLPCIATFTALSFPVFAVAPYPYFTLTNGSTVVYTSAIGASGTITMPFTPTSTTLFITIFFKAPPTGFSGSVLTWQNFTITTPAMITTGSSTTTGNLNVSGATTIGTVANTVALTVNQSGTVPTVQFNSSAPDSCLDLNCTAVSGRKYRIGSAGTGTGAGVGNFFIYDATASLPRMVIDSLGRMGLGRINPTYQFHMYNDATTANQPLLLIESTSTANGYNASLLLKTGTNTSQINTDAAGNLALNANTPGIKWVSVGGDNSSKLSAGTNEPQTFIGYRKFMVAGTSGNSEGGHVAYYTTSDYYPLYQQLNWEHNNIFQGYDMYYDGTFRTSFNGTGFAFYKQGNAFRLYYANGTQGAGVGLTTAMEVNSSGVISQPQKPFVIVGAVGGASIGYGAGTNFGQGGYLYAYTSAGYSNTPGSGWASNNGRFWATILGRYQVNFCFYWNNFAAGSRAVMRHFNSAGGLVEDRYCALNGGGIGADTTQNYSTIVYMAAGSWLEFSFQSGSGTLYFGGITHTHCSFHFLA